MIFQISIISTRQFSFKAFTDLLGLNDCILAITPNEVKGTWAFYRKEHATTLFCLNKKKKNMRCQWTGWLRMTTTNYGLIW